MKKMFSKNICCNLKVSIGYVFFVFHYFMEYEILYLFRDNILLNVQAIFTKE